MAEQGKVVRTSWALGCVIAIAACGGNEPEPLFTPENTGGEAVVSSREPVRERGDTSVTAAVGPAGGVLELSNGAKLEIPEGALGDEIEVIFGLGAQTRAFANREWERPLGPTLIIQPEMVAQPGALLVVSAPLASIPEPFTEEDVRLATEAVDDMDPMSDVRPTVQTIWQYNAASVEGSELRAEVDHLPGMRVQFLLSRDD